MNSKTGVLKIVTIFLMAASLAPAATLYWAPPGAGTWDTSTANWTGDSTTYTDGGVDTVNFTNSAGGLITLNANHNPAGVVVSAPSGTYTINGANITGSGSLTKSGAGKLVLLTNNTFTGGITISGGEIEVGDHLNRVGGYPAPGSAQTIHFTSDATITLSSSVAGGGYTYDPILIDSGVTATLGRTGSGNTYPNFAGNISGDGAVTVTGTSSSYVNLSGSNTFKGNLRAVGNVGVDYDQNLGDPNNTTILDGGSLFLSLFSGVSTYSASRTLQVNSGFIASGYGAIWNGLVTGNGFTVQGNLALPSLFLANTNNSFVGNVYVQQGWLEVNHPGALNGNQVVLQNSGITGLRISGTPTAEFTNTLSMSSYNPIYFNVTNQNADIQWNGLVQGSGGFAKTGAGALTLKKASPSFTSAVDVREGRLSMNFNTANLSSVTVSNNASLGGSGTINITGGAAIKGDGSIDPGNSPGILTAAALDPISGAGTLDFNFEFTQHDSPDYTNPTASSNDVLRLTGTSPFSGDVMTSANVINVYLPGNLISGTNNFRGGFYTDAGDFLGSFSGATYNYYAEQSGGPYTYNGKQYNWMTNVYPGGVMFATTVNETGTQFGSVDGYVMEFIGLGIPEPSSLLLVMLSGLMCFHRRRK